MNCYRDLSEVLIDAPTVLTIGSFDGVHLGHRALVAQVKEMARRHGAQSAVIGFHPRPKTVLNQSAPQDDYLTTAEEQMAQFAELGIDHFILLPFTLELSQMTAAAFMTRMTHAIQLVELWVGYDFALGNGREGNVERLTELGLEYGYTVRKFEPFSLENTVVSSSKIRQWLREGEIRSAGQLLGRLPSVQGTIVKGDQRGRTIGFPTANIQLAAERLVPRHGVYATWLTRHATGERLPSVTNIGMRPTFDGLRRQVEAYIFDFDEDIYEEVVSLEFAEFLRREQKFAGIEALIAQIKADAEQARTLLRDDNGT